LPAAAAGMAAVHARTLVDGRKHARTHARMVDTRACVRGGGGGGGGGCMCVCWYQYSGAGEGKPLPTVLAVCTDSINRGACIAAFSQYPQEVLLCILSPPVLPCGACIVASSQYSKEMVCVYIYMI